MDHENVATLRTKSYSTEVSKDLAGVTWNRGNLAPFVVCYAISITVHIIASKTINESL